MRIVAVTFLYVGLCDNFTPREILSVICNSFSDMLHYLNRLYLIWLLPHCHTVSVHRRLKDTGCSLVNWLQMQLNGTSVVG